MELCTVAHCGVSRRGSRPLRLGAGLGNAFSFRCGGDYSPFLLLQYLFQWPVLGRAYLSKDHIDILVLRAIKNTFF